MLYIYARLIEMLKAMGVDVPPFPKVRVPPCLEKGDPGESASPEEKQADAELQERIDLWCVEIEALYARHVRGHQSSSGRGGGASV